MNRAGFHFRKRISAAILCGLLVSPGIAQNSTAPAAPSASTPAATIAQQAQLAQQQAQQPVATQPFHVQMPHSHNPFSSYMASSVMPLDLSNSSRLQLLMRDGKLYLSLKDAMALALENNLDLAYWRYNLPIAEADYARTKAGGVANGVTLGLASNTQGGNGGGFGAGGANAGAGSASGGAGSAGGGQGGLVQSTLGSGTLVHSFDPLFQATGWVDHTTLELTNSVTQGGIPLFHQNTIEAQSQYLQYFPLGTHVEFDYQGLRQASNNAANSVNPTLQSAFQFFVFQPLLAGFGPATNTRYMHIAKNTRVLTDLGFKQQVIATVTQVEDIYWDLVNAYQDEQVKERSLQFAQKTLEDDKKQLELQAIPAMQVMKDESDEATREGDLTVAKATLKLNELYIKNALTKSDDAQLEDMPVVPTDRIGAPDENADKPIEELIAQAQKNRGDLAMDQIAMQTAQISLKATKNELLPSLSVYGEYAGQGNAGQPNPSCVNCPPPTGLPSGFGGSLQNAFNYTSPEYQVGFQLSITLRNRIVKADQFRSELEYRQKELLFEQQKKGIRFDVRNSQYALQQARAHVVAAQKSRDLAQRTFDVTKQEQSLGAKSSFDTLTAEHDLSVSESALVTAETAYEKAKVDIDRAIGDTLEHNMIAIDDAKTGVAAHLQP